MFCAEDGYKLTPGRKKKTPINFRAWLENEEGNKIFDGNLYIYLPDLFFIIHQFTNQSLEFIKEEWMKFYKDNSEMLSMDRTSEIFVTGRTRGGRVEKRRIRFFIKYNDFFYSHARLRKPVSKW